MTVVDRSVDPLVHLPYTIPLSDTCIGAGEVEDSRTHQYVALCRMPGPWESLPHWLDLEDVEDALAAGALLQTETPPDAEILERAPGWVDCHSVIGSDEDRRPIHCSHAIDGIQWNTSQLPAGVWVLAGYTYQPPLNMWSPRQGVFKVVDGTSPDLPAAGLHPHAEQAGDDPPFQVTACVDAEPGSTLTVSVADGEDEPDAWFDLSSVVVQDTGDVPFELDLSQVFDAAVGVAIRVRVETPSGASFTYVSPRLVTYFPGPTPDQPPPSTFDYCEDPATLQPQNCPMSDTAGTASTGGEETTDPDGCNGCRTGTAGALAPGWLSLVVLMGRRRRHHAPSCSFHGNPSRSGHLRDRSGLPPRRGAASSSLPPTSDPAPTGAASPSCRRARYKRSPETPA